MKRYPVTDEDFDEPTQHSVVRARAPSSVTAAQQVQAQLGALGYSSDLFLVQQTAQQEAELRAQADRIEELESQRRWLWGGLGASAAVLLLLAFRKRRPPVTSPPYPGQLSGKRTAA